jgi:hypothetical protein
MKLYDIAPIETLRGSWSDDAANGRAQQLPRLRRAAATLLGISFLLVTALRFTHMSDQTLGDEIAWFAGLFFLGCICLSLIAAPRGLRGHWAEVWSARLFVAGVAILGAATVGIVLDLH